jgi:serine/threonine protein phosphatase PrpC
MKYGVCKEQGKRRNMEDRAVVEELVFQSPAFRHAAFFGVFDGHAGDQVRA